MQSPSWGIGVVSRNIAARGRSSRGSSPRTSRVSRSRAARIVRAMRMTTLFLPTERQPPADAEALSHKLMVRAGLVRQLGAGLWTWLPAGWRVHQRIVQIVREE